MFLQGDLDDEALSRMLEITNKLSRVSLRYTDNSAGPLAKAGRERTKHFTEIALNEVVPSGMDCTDGGDKEHKLPEKAQIHSEFTNDLEAVQFITVKEMSAHTEDLISECPMGDQESDAKNLNMLGNASMGSEALLSHHNIDSLRSASQKQMRHHATKHSKPNKTSPGDDVLPIIPSTPKAQDVIQKYCTDDKQADEEPEDDNSMDMEAGDTTAKEGGESQELLQQWRNWLRMQSSVEGSPGRLADPSLLKHGFADGTRGAQLSDTPGLELRGGAADAASPGMHATTSRRTHGLQGAGRESWSSPPSADFFHRIPPDSGLDVPQLGSAEIPRDYNSKTMSLRGWGSILQDESELIATSDKPARPEWPSDWDSEALSLGPGGCPALSCDFLPCAVASCAIHLTDGTTARNLRLGAFLETFRCQEC